MATKVKERLFKFNFSDPDGDALVKYEIKTTEKGHAFGVIV